MTRRTMWLAVAAGAIGMALVAYPGYLVARAVVQTARDLDALTAEPADVPSSEERARMVADGRGAGLPAYWLGAEYDGRPVNSVVVGPTGVTVGYGDQVCDTGCWYPVTVWTSSDPASGLPGPGERHDAYGGTCFRVLRGVPMDSCAPPEALL